MGSSLASTMAEQAPTQTKVVITNFNLGAPASALGLQQAPVPAAKPGEALVRIRCRPITKYDILRYANILPSQHDISDQSYVKPNRVTQSLRAMSPARRASTKASSRPCFRRCPARRVRPRKAQEVCLHCIQTAAFRPVCGVPHQKVQSAGCASVELTRLLRARPAMIRHSISSRKY